jgi:hypothetical protein
MGRLSETTSKTFPKVLQELNVQIRDPEVCRKLGAKINFYFPEKMICAGNLKSYSEYQDPFSGGKRSYSDDKNPEPSLSIA